MKQPQDHDSYITSKDGDFSIINLTWSKLGVCRAWWGYSDTCLAVAGGYGYDKASVVLASAIQKLYKISTIKGGGAGVEAVIRSCAENGIYLNSTKDEAIKSVLAR